MYVSMLNLRMQNPLESIGKSPKRKLKNNNFKNFGKMKRHRIMVIIIWSLESLSERSFVFRLSILPCIMW